MHVGMSAAVTALAARIVSDKASGSFILTPSPTAQTSSAQPPAAEQPQPQPHSPAGAEGAGPSLGEHCPPLPTETPARPLGEGLGQVCSLWHGSVFQATQEPLGEHLGARPQTLRKVGNY